MKTVFAIFGFCLLAACAQMPLVSPQKLRIAVPRHPSSLIVVSAQKEHFFADTGLRVEIVPYENPSLSYLALIEGKVDFAIVDTASFVFAPNSKVSILSELYSSSRGLYLVLPDSKARSIDGILNSTLHVKPHSAEEWFINLLTLTEGLNINSNRIELRKSLNPDFSKNKRVGFVANSLELKKLRNAYPDVGFRAFGSRVHMDVSFLAGPSQLEKENNPKLERLLLALAKAEEHLRRDADSADPALAELLGVKNDVALKEIREGALYRLGLSNSLYVLLQEQDKWVRSRYQRQTAKLNISQHLRPEFLRKIKPGSVTLSDTHFEVAK